MRLSLDTLRRFKRALVEFNNAEKGRSWVKSDKEKFFDQLQLLASQDWQVAADFFCAADKTATTGFDRHYVYHPAWAFRKLTESIKPEKHIDISSTLHFCSMLSAVMPVDFYDYRPADLVLQGLSTHRGDLNALPFAHQSVASISCMHTVEHIGLGRYGDTIDAMGDMKAMHELQRVVAVGGSLLFVTPVGDTNQLHFNAHRVYKPEHIVNSFRELKLQEFYYVPGQDGAPKVMQADSQLIKGEKYGCGCFWFSREKSFI